MIVTGSKERTFDRVKVVKYGQMARCTKAGGKTIKLMVKEDLSMPMAMSTMVSGRTIRHMAMESIAI